MAQKWKQKHRNTGYECDGPAMAEEDAVVQKKQRSEREETLEYADEVLADIDEVLAETLGDFSAQRFVAGYQQKGGQ